MSQREDAHLLSGAYALDAVTPEEAALVEAAMVESEDLHSEVVGLADTAVALGLGLPAVTPPPSLRARLLVAIDSYQQEAPEPEEAPEGFGPVSAIAMPAGEHTVQRRRARRRPMALIVSVAAALAIFTGGFFAQRTLFETQTEYLNISTASDVRHVDARVAGGGIATVSWSKSEHRTAVVLKGVSAPSGKVLQLWSIRGGTTTSAGLYEPQAGQNYTLLAGTPNSGETLAVSVEPDGGSTQPTTLPIVSVRLSA